MRNFAPKYSDMQPGMHDASENSSQVMWFYVGSTYAWKKCMYNKSMIHFYTGFVLEY